MDEASTLEEELEQELLLEPDEKLLPLSTPRQRLEEARAMADGSCGVEPSGEEDYSLASKSANGGDEEEQQNSIHLLQRLSCTMADGGEWKCFHDINHESQRALAEMNETLGSLRQWQKHRKAGSSLIPCVVSAEDASATTAGEELLSGTNPSVGFSSHSAGLPTKDSKHLDGEKGKACEKDVHHNFDDDMVEGAEQEDPLLVLWKEHHLRAQQAVGRLQDQLDRHPPVSSLRPHTAIVLDNDSDEKRKAEADIAKALTIRDSPAKEGDALSAEPSPSNGGKDGNTDRVAELGRDVDGLQVRQWIQSTRTQACDRAETLAREACEDVWRGAGSAAVGEIEGELDRFAKELDSLLLRIDHVDDDTDIQEDAGEHNLLRAETPPARHAESELAPVADAHVKCRAAAD